MNRPCVARRPGQPASRCDGFTLMESLFSILALSVAVAGFFGLHLSMLRRNSFSGRVTVATALAQQVIEGHLAAGALSSGTTTDSNGLYTVHSVLSTDGAARGVLIEVRVSWTNPNGRASRITLNALGPSS